MLRLGTFTTFAVLLLAGASVNAQNVRWLDYSPVRFFTDADWEMAKSAARNALENSKDNEAVAWSNESTGNSGSVTPLDRQEKDGRTCRSLAIENQARGMSGRSVFRFCRQADGTWKIDPE